MYCFNLQAEYFAKLRNGVEGDIHTSTLDARDMTIVDACESFEFAERKTCGIASLSDGQAYGLASDAPDGGRPFRAVRLARIGLRLDDLAGSIGQRHRRAFALLDFGIGKGVSRDAVVLTIVISAILLVSAKHELLRVYIGGFSASESSAQASSSPSISSGL